jgi:hypothetical protein
VGWGDQTTDEMMIGYFDILVPRGTAEATSARARRRALIRKLVQENLFGRLDTDGNERIERKEIPQRWKNQFDLLDVDGNDAITRDELRGESPE